MLTAAMEVSRRDWNARLVEMQAESDRELLCYAGLTCWGFVVLAALSAYMLS